MAIDPITERAIIDSVLPKIRSVADEIEADLFSPDNIPVESGHLRQSTYLTVHPDGVIEGGSTADYAQYVHDGTHNGDGSVKQHANPYLSRVFYKIRRDR